MCQVWGAMDLVRVCRVVLRRWVVVVLVATIGLGVTFAVAQTVPSRYQSDGSMLLLSQATVLDPSGKKVTGNPYQRFGSTGEAVTASVMARVAMGSEFKAMLAREGVDADYVIAVSASGGGAVVDFSVVTDSAGGAQASLQRIMTFWGAEVLAYQERAGAPEITWIRASILTVSDEPLVLNGARLRITAVLVLASGAAAVGAALLMEAAASARRRRRPGVVKEDQIAESSAA